MLLAAPGAIVSIGAGMTSALADLKLHSSGKVREIYELDGDLLVRVDPERDRELGALPGAGPAEMGVGRAMGPGWISVAAEAVADDEELSFWIGVALEHNQSAGRTGR
jgi:hypothetical protein